MNLSLNLRKAVKIKSTLQIASQIAERVCTLRSLIERRYAIVGWLKNYQKLIVGEGRMVMVIVGGGWNGREG